MSDLAELSGRLQLLAGLDGKRDIQAPARVFPHQPFPDLGAAAGRGSAAARL